MKVKNYFVSVFLHSRCAVLFKVGSGNSSLSFSSNRFVLPYGYVAEARSCQFISFFFLV